MNQIRGYDAIVIGGGAAGLFCASLIGKSGKSVAVLERTRKVGKKILMSGGGRCNFTNLYVEPENYLSANPHFCKSALSRYTQWDFIGLVSEYSIPYHEKKLGQLFCDNSAKDILEMLLQECDRAGVVIYTECDIQSVRITEDKVGSESRFALDTRVGQLQSEALIVASGGLSIPTMGSSGFGYDLARQFGMAVLPTRAGLVPLTFTDELKGVCESLSGVSVDVSIENDRYGFQESVLFTHRGLSGPAILQQSSYWHQGETLRMDLLPGFSAESLLLEKKQQRPKSLLKTQLNEHLPKKLVLALEALWWPKWATIPMGEIPNEVLVSIAGKLNQWQLKPAGSEGYRTAEVTLGGVDTDGLSSKTLESQSVSGLFFIGEVVDVTGHLGGFNFQWAWSSAHAAAQAVVA